jgi:hypothetical protein
MDTPYIHAHGYTYISETHFICIDAHTFDVNPTETSTYAFHARVFHAPPLHTFTARGLAGGDREGLGGEPHGASHVELLLLGTTDQVGAHCTPYIHAHVHACTHTDITCLRSFYVAKNSNTPFSRDFTFLLVSVMRMRCSRCSSPSTPPLTCLLILGCDKVIDERLAYS